jgi:hypothetical protein
MRKMVLAVVHQFGNLEREFAREWSAIHEKYFSWFNLLCYAESFRS